MTKHAIDERLLVELVAGRSAAEAATRLGISSRTAYRRIATPEFQTELAAARRQVVDTALGRLLAASEAAVDALRRLIEEGPPNVRLAAARAVLELGPRYREHVEMDDRLDAIERALGSETTGPTP